MQVDDRGHVRTRPVERQVQSEFARRRKVVWRYGSHGGGYAVGDAYGREGGAAGAGGPSAGRGDPAPLVAGERCGQAAARTADQTGLDHVVSHVRELVAQVAGDVVHPVTPR